MSRHNICMPPFKIIIHLIYCKTQSVLSCLERNLSPTASQCIYSIQKFFVEPGIIIHYVDLSSFSSISQEILAFEIAPRGEKSTGKYINSNAFHFVSQCFQNKIRVLILRILIYTSYGSIEYLTKRRRGTRASNQIRHSSLEEHN